RNENPRSGNAGIVEIEGTIVAAAEGEADSIDLAAAVGTHRNFERRPSVGVGTARMQVRRVRAERRLRQLAVLALDPSPAYPALFFRKRIERCRDRDGRP